MRATTAVLAALAAACSAAGECPGGAPPPLASCVAGELFADCDGDGAPRLACSSAAQRCTWFATSCVAEGYVVSSCPASNVCCEEDNWPFADSRFLSFLHSRLYAFGTAPWDRTREMHVTVTVDAALPVAPRAYVCDGVDPIQMGRSPCNSFRADGTKLAPITKPIRDGDFVAFTFEAAVSFGGWTPFIEIDAAAGRARVCAARYVDYAIPRCPSGDTVCASSGTVTLTALPTSAAEWSSMRGHLDVQLGTLHLTADF